MSIKIYGKGEKAPFYKKYNGQMNAVFGCPCFVEETDLQFIVDPIDEEIPIINTDVIYAPKKEIIFRSEQAFTIT
jgi:hypothetical protein